MTDPSGRRIVPDSESGETGMRRAAARVGGLLLVGGFLLVIIPGLYAVLSVHGAGRDFCAARQPEGLVFEGEGPPMSYGWSLIPLQWNCTFWEPETHVTTDFGTAPLLAGLALGGIGAGLCLSSVLRRSSGELLPGA